MMTEDAATVQTAIRFPRPLYDKILERQHKMVEANPGLTISFSDTVRSLVEQALAAPTGKGRR